MIASLNCPNCGAPAAGAEASRCEYCASTLTSMACPACFGSMFVGMQFCPHCGAKGERVVADGAPLVCPGCRAEMRQVRVGSTPLHECAACGGTWVDAETFAGLCRDREERGAIAAMVGSGGVELAAPKSGAVRYVPCPLCKRVMNRENFGRRSGVIIDVCKGHGVWFEARELQGVMAFIDRGGLQRSRALDAERQQEEARKQARDRAGVSGVSMLRSEDNQSVFVRSTFTSTSSGDSLLEEALHILFS